jgi:hypothetical protein
MASSKFAMVFAIVEVIVENDKTCGVFVYYISENESSSDYTDSPVSRRKSKLPFTDTKKVCDQVCVVPITK